MTLKIDEMLPLADATDDGTSSLTVADIITRREWIDRQSYERSQRANLYEHVLVAIRDGADDPVALAKAALGESE